MEKHSSFSKLVLLAFLLLTISASALGSVQPITETELNDDVTKTIIQELAKEQLLAAYYYKQEKSGELGLEEAALAAKKTLKCREKGEPCGPFLETCCSNKCFKFSGVFGLCL